MNKFAPMFVTLKTAAALFEMKPQEFKQLVEQGILPKARSISTFERWDAQELQSIVRGEPMTGFEDVKW